MIVVDANLLVAMISGDPRGTTVFEKFAQWIRDDVELHAPALAQYEVANALTRLIVARMFEVDRLERASVRLSSLPIEYHPIDNAKRVVEIALELTRQTAYDAAYLALAEELRTEVWTLDGPLYRNASARGLPVRLLA